jgi:multiple sugar transport system substrate-binding protein
MTLKGLAVVAVASLVLANSAEGQQSFDWKKFSGRTVNVALAKQPWSDFITPHIPEFEKLTGIKVRLEVLPEEQNRQKLAIAFAAGRGDIDVFGSQRHNEGAKYHKAKWYEPLKPLIDNPSLTAPEFDFADFAPQAVNDATVGGELIGIPLYSELQVMAYRKDLLRDAGLAVPNTLDELEAAAKKLTDREKGIYGICMRGKGAATTTIYSGILHSMGGNWVDEKGDPALNSPAGVKALEYYGRLARDSGPPGVENYHWLQCQNLFGSGKAAFWTDSNIFYAPFLDPAKSTVADKVGFAVFPEGPGGRKPAGGGWYLSIYSKARNKDAAWYFIQWAVSKENALKAQLQAIPTGRLSAWQSEVFTTSDRAPELTKATLDSLKLKDTPSWGPPFVAVGEIRDVMGAAVVAVIQGNDAKAAADKTVTQIQAIRQKTEN